MADPFIGEIRMFGFNFAPRGWAFCQGQVLPISQNTALFSILGTTYGGNGETTFALPNLQGRSPINAGQGPGLSLRSLGETGGSETVTLIASQIPLHSHGARAANANAIDKSSRVPYTAASPARTFGKSHARALSAGYAPGPADVTMSAMAVTPTGGGVPHNNLSPYLALNFCIALQGVYPPRN